MSDELTIEMLKNVSLFSGLEDSDIEKLTQIVQKGTIPADTEFFKEGDTGDAFYILTDGEVEIVKIINGEKKVVNTIKSSDTSNFFGEMALIEDLPRNATVVSKTQCEILEIEKKDFDFLIKLNSFFALRVMKALTKRLREDIPSAVASSAQKEEKKDARVITFFSPKGGSGKTTIATNFAYGLAKYLNKKVMLIDLDLQFGGIAFMLGLKAKKTIADLTDTGALRGYDDVKQCLIKHSSGFDLLPAPTKPEQSESVDSNHVRKIVTCSKDQYDYIIIDTHSLLQEISINALDLSDLIMIVMNPDLSHIVAVHNCLKVMDSLKYSKDKMRLVLNRFQAPFTKSKEEIDTALQKDGVKVNFIVHDDTKVSSELINNCKTIFEITEKSEYRIDIGTMLTEITKEKLPSEAGAGKGLFGSIMSWLNS